MTSLPKPNEIMSAPGPFVLRGDAYNDEFDVVRFLYNRDDVRGKSVETIEIEYVHRQSGERTGMRFRGVKLVGFFPFCVRDDAQLVVANNALSPSKRLQPRMLEIRYEVCDGVKEVVFWAGSVEAI